jgi:diamine N-acetyltransferase
VKTEITIREITDPVEFVASVRVIRSSFRTVAKEFGLTRENAPTHPSLFPVSRLKEMTARGAKSFGLFLDKKQIGFIAVQKMDEAVYEIERLAVLPSQRHDGYGARLVGFAIDYIRGQQGKKITLGMINESTVLKNWYIGLGFKEVRIQKFPHLPFTVCFMERDTSPLISG